MNWLQPVVDFFTKNPPSLYVALGSLVVAAVALITTWRSSSSTRVNVMQKDVLELEALLLSNQVRDARLKVLQSPPVIRKAGQDYSPLSSNKSYLKDSEVMEAINEGAAKDSDELTTAYSTIVMCIIRATAIIPNWKIGRSATYWKKMSPAIYGQLDELLSTTDETRWEFHKIPLLWPLDMNTLAADKLTLLSDKNLRRNVDLLNSHRGKGAIEIKIPHRDDLGEVD
ncbi:hypothetical protein [Bifidobacterium mongoliense]|uniref:hypothetical protein n=1 Tax=Bifidobacterium mongoliense TaxID=518643 RepID=UPI002647905D|nr:hypothetical protein [Bifidobacterium mongoliense]MDN6025440.1 hypothetical protein [Bifidobacterium mongoliense]MDN6720083.1 hypothetical protein [Bifidobacterium mongoliense]